MNKFFSILLFPLTFIRFILVWVGMLFFTMAVIIEDKLCKQADSFMFWSSKNWGKTMLLVLGIRVKRNQLPVLEKYLLMPNHRSYIDVFLAAAYSPSAFVAKAEVARWPLLGPALKAGRAILVQRNEMRSLLDTLKKIQQSVENNISITVFPEGTTFQGPGTKSFKGGTFKIAAQLGLPIIPCAIEYRDKNMAWVGNDTFVGHFFRQLWKPISWVGIRFGEPVTGNNSPELKEKIRQSIEQMLLSIHHDFQSK